MNEKRCKRMRGYAHNIARGDVLYAKKIYKALKKGYKNSLKLARLMATSNQFTKRTKTNEEVFRELN